MTVIPQELRLALNCFEVKVEGRKLERCTCSVLLFHLERDPSKDLRVSFHQRQMHLFPVLHYLCPTEKKKHSLGTGVIHVFINVERRAKYANEAGAPSTVKRRVAECPAQNCKRFLERERICIPGRASFLTGGRPSSRLADGTLRGPHRPTIVRACPRRLVECCT